MTKPDIKSYSSRQGMYNVSAKIRESTRAGVVYPCRLVNPLNYGSRLLPINSVSLVFHVILFTPPVGAIIFAFQGPARAGR